jgi:hypothetical protein
LTQWEQRRSWRRKCFGAAAQRRDASAGGGDFEKRIMLKDCCDANTVSWRQERLRSRDNLNKVGARKMEARMNRPKWECVPKLGEMTDGGNVLEPQHNAEMQVLEAVILRRE